MHSGRTWRLGQRPALDGLRGVAILLVLAGHLTQSWWPTALGSIGVTVFFTLSGFLITALLLEEAADRPVSLRRFYARRAYRLFPALVAMVAAAGAVTVAAGIGSVSMIGWVIAYGGNWYSVGGHITGMFGHTWSLAIEEQFYLVWPIALIAVRRWRRGPLVLAGGGVAVAIALRLILWDGGAGAARVYFGTDTRADSLLVGCGAAVLLHSGVRLRVSGVVATSIAAVTLLGLVVLPSSPWAGIVLTQTLVPWAAVLLLVHALTAPRWLTGSVLRWFGQRSYGIYLWNWPFVVAASLITSYNPVAIAVATVLGVGVGELSWRLVEAPIMARRRASSTLASASQLRAAIPATT